MRSSRLLGAGAAALILIATVGPSATLADYGAWRVAADASVLKAPPDVPDGMWFDPSSGTVRSDALAADAALIAERRGLRFDDVLAALEAQQSMGAIVDKVRGDYPSFVGLYWDEQMKAFAQFTETAPAAALEMLQTSGVAVQPEVVRYSAQELSSLQDEVLASIQAMKIEDYGVGIDERSQRVVVDLGASTSSPSDVAHLEAEFAGRPIAVSVIQGATGELLNAYGGAQLGTGGFNCTSGFTVASGATTGIATAGHCGSGMTDYFDAFTGTTHTLTYQNGHVASFGDFEWFTTNGFEPDAFYLPNGALRDVSGVKNSFTVGESVNWWGWATQVVFVDTIQYTNYNWSGVGHLGCTNGAGGASGDSGGPFYLGNTSYGFMRGLKTIDGFVRTCFSQSRYIDDAIGVSIRQ